MGLIKHSRITETGEIVLKTKPLLINRREESVQFEENAPQEETAAEEYSGPHLELSEAEQNIREMIDHAKQEAQSIKKKAQEEGLALGKSKADESVKEALGTLNQAVVERKKIIKDAESEILRLALKSAEQIIRSEVSLHRDVCLNIVSDAINRVSDREQVIVRVNREDAEYIKKYKDRLSGIIDGVKSFSVLEDSQIEPGGCIIETNLGYVDARISTKLHSIEEALTKASGSGDKH